ncbi:MAG TPA: hypothetical protein VKB93_04110, partial [Thermoanaerobaculia bacterium]|nr:hypothetical protein [Thermoanaerobaculia bacterium]
MLAIVLAAALTVPVPGLNLNVTVVKAKEPHDDAIFVLAGGPGVAATGMEGFATRTFAESGRDLVLIDARGTGKSNPLHCDFGGSDADLQRYFTGFLPLDKVQECRDELAKRTDLTQYTTSRIATTSRLYGRNSDTSRSISTARRTARASRSSTCAATRSACARRFWTESFRRRCTGRRCSPPKRRSRS